MKEIGYVLYGIYVLLTVWLLLSSAMQWHLWRKARKLQRKKQVAPSGTWPFVTIQVPVYNEKYVVEGLLQCLSQLNYPTDCFEILVLDDSTDETSSLIDRTVDELKREGLSVSTIRRTDRVGYKAGALQGSLPFCKGQPDRCL
jgi:cellulose synthase/poly-beta-1,6-N-acetylglucosamine synthase-like glycosyltransferase